MNREKFCSAMRKRGYEVTNLGLITFVADGNYTAMWFFNPDGTRDETKPAMWHLDRSK